MELPGLKERLELIEAKSESDKIRGQVNALKWQRERLIWVVRELADIAEAMAKE